MRAYLAAIFTGLAFFWLARGIGIPTWRNWESGDATDIALCAAMAAYLIIHGAKP